MQGPQVASRSDLPLGNLCLGNGTIRSDGVERHQLWFQRRNTSELSVHDFNWRKLALAESFG
jgi:hypothetical protein